MNPVPLERLLKMIPDERRKLFGILLGTIQRHSFCGVHQGFEISRIDASQPV